MSVTAISYSTRAHTTCKHCRVKTWDQASLSRLSERDRERERWCWRNKLYRHSLPVCDRTAAEMM